LLEWLGWLACGDDPWDADWCWLAASAGIVIKAKTKIDFPPMLAIRSSELITSSQIPLISLRSNGITTAFVFCLSSTTGADNRRITDAVPNCSVHSEAAIPSNPGSGV